MMTRFSLPLALCLALGAPVAPAATGSLADGFEAYLHSDLATVAWIFRGLAEEGDAAAQYMLGGLYARGEGVERDPVLAHRWLSAAADQGHQPAARLRDELALRMSPEQLAEARALAANPGRRSDDAEASPERTAAQP